MWLNQAHQKRRETENIINYIKLADEFSRQKAFCLESKTEKNYNQMTLNKN